ncbi:MAG: bifunctional 2-polyprenyl-6-hydroxyphenol methylase/3-demethylubiquinol 3-O-methyltransferase UbiG, partial [Pseudomonadota bacterium]
MAADTTAPNADPEEIAKFNALAHRWWDPDGDFKALHDINPARLAYISQRSDLAHGQVLDVGCGGGILTEAMAESGASVTGIDMAERPLGVARLHALEGGVEIDYRASTAEELAATGAQFTTVTCLEMLEHVTDYPATVAACAALAAPGGQLFFSTINRNPKSYALLILG